MRALFFSLILAGMGPFLRAQTAPRSVQISVQAAHQANQQMIQASQQANQSAMAAQQASLARCHDCATLTPRFSMKAGTYSVPLTVTITADRKAAIYYTLDGWTPTPNSEKYTGPIEIDSTSTLQAIAVSPRGIISRVNTADYKLPNSEPVSVFAGLPPVEIPNAASSGKWMIPKGTAVPLLFTSTVNSSTSKIGDKLKLELAEDITSDGVVLLRRGTPSIATITGIDRPRAMGVPSEIFFTAEYIHADGTRIRLLGSAAKQGLDHERKAAALMIGIPAGLLVRGKDAEIEQGALFTAYVAEDTLLRPH